jgi:hypothetical protein
MAQRFHLISSRRGNALALVGVCLVPILGVLALVLDGGLLMIERRRAQTIVDAAALSAAPSLYNNYPQLTTATPDPGGKAKAAALAIAASNGYTNDGTSSIVTVNIPPTSRSYTTTLGYVEVIAQSSQSHGFSAIWSSGRISVGARAVARGISQAYTNAGLLVLDPSAQGALTLTGGASLTSNAPVIVDSHSTKAIVGSSTAGVTAPEIDITGNYSLSGQASLNGTVITGKTPTPDPLANLPTPDPTSMTSQSSSGLSISGATMTLSPGVYTGGISLSGGAAVTLKPGIYYIKGGGFKMSGSSSLTGTGVMIYNDPASSSDAISLSGSGALSLTPPTSGT